MRMALRKPILVPAREGRNRPTNISEELTMKSEVLIEVLLAPEPVGELLGHEWH